MDPLDTSARIRDRAPGDDTTAPGRTPYRASWIDRLTDRVDRLPVPSVLVYVSVWALVFMTETSLKWLDGSYGPWTFRLKHVDFTYYGLYILAMAHYLDRHALRAFTEFAPALRDGADPANLRYRLTTLPARPAVLASAAFVAWGLVAEVLNPAYVRSAGIFTSVPATVFEAILIFAYHAIAGAGIFHVVHQLRIVNEIFREHARVDPLAPEPLYALASIPARTALVVMVLPWVFLATTPGVFDSGLLITYLVLGLALAILLFVVPLWDAHLMLRRAKRAILRDIGLELDRVIRDLTGACRSNGEGSASALVRHRESFEALRAAREVVRGTPTWPWSPEAPRVLGSAILLPVAVYVIQRIVERTLL